MKFILLPLKARASKFSQLTYKVKKLTVLILGIFRITFLFNETVFKPVIRGKDEQTIK